MYVVVLILDGDLKMTANRRNPNDALELAQEWVLKHQDKAQSGYVAIDEQIRGKSENRHFAKVTFENQPDNIKFYLREKGENPLLSSRIPPLFKTFMFTLVEFALVELKDSLKEYRGDSKLRRDRY